MSDINLTEQLEFDAAFLAELQAGGPNYAALVELLKENKVCDFGGFTEIIGDERIRQAAFYLREKSTPSQYRRRLTARMYLNPDDLTTGRTAYWIEGLPSSASIPTSARALAFPLLAGDHEDLFTPDSSLNTAFTITTAGAYKLNFNAMLGCFPHLSNVTNVNMPTSITHRFTATPGAPVSSPLDIVLRVETATTTTYTTLASIVVYATDYAKLRTRFICGSKVLRLHSISRLSLHIQRRASFGQFVDIATSESFAEAVGFAKLITTIPGVGNPTRDNHNYLEITRLT